LAFNAPHGTDPKIGLRLTNKFFWTSEKGRYKGV